jgi:hypothetical protein
MIGTIGVIGTVVILEAKGREGFYNGHEGLIGQDLEGIGSNQMFVPF